MSDLVTFSTPRSDFVPLARSRKGRLFKKQILPPLGSSFVHPANPSKRVLVDEAFAKSLVKNFENGGDIVQVPLANDHNEHVEDPTRNVGEVVGLSYDQSGVYATIDARKYADDFGNTILGASALMSLDYGDTLSGDRRGPTLLHVALTNRPYLNHLRDFEEVIGLSADTHREKPDVLVPVESNEKEPEMDLDTMLKTLKDEHGIDVQDLQTRAAANSDDLVLAMTNVLKTVKPEAAADTASVETVSQALLEVVEENVALSATVNELKERSDALVNQSIEAEVDGLVSEGRVLPKQRDVFVALARTNREQFDALVPEEPLVALSAQGVQTHEESTSEKYKADIERYSEMAQK